MLPAQTPTDNVEPEENELIDNAARRIALAEFCSGFVGYAREEIPEYQLRVAAIQKKRADEAQALAVTKAKDEFERIEAARKAGEEAARQAEIRQQELEDQCQAAIAANAKDPHDKSVPFKKGFRF